MSADKPDDRILTEEETDHFMATCYVQSLEQDLEDLQQVVGKQAQLIADCKLYIKMQERMSLERETKIAKLNATLEALETALLKAQKAAK